MNTRKHARPAAARRILLVSRNSGQQGKRSRRLAAVEAHRTAEDLLKYLGIDVRHLIPPVDDLADMLKSSAVRKASYDSTTKKRFVNEFLYLDLTPQVRLLVSTGSGRKIDLDLAQPFLTEVNRELKSGGYSHFVYHRSDRVFRTDLLGANTLHVCKHLDITIVDGETGVMAGDFGPIMALLQAHHSSEEARRTIPKTRSGQISWTDTDMSCIRKAYEARAESASERLPYEACSIRYGVALSPPAGMMVVRMKSARGQRGEGRLFFDSPKYYPDPVTVAYGLPEIFISSDDESWRPDQVENVRSALSMIGRPICKLTGVALDLIDRGFSTHRQRMETSVSTPFTLEQVDGDALRVLRPILQRLDFYETGELPLRFGVEGIEDVTIRNCFPPDGPWATEADFKRIRDFLATTTGGGPAIQGLTGVPMMTEAGPIPLRTAPKNRQGAGPAYVIRPADSGVSLNLSLPPLPHSVLADSIVDALRRHADSLLEPLVRADLPQDEALRSELQAAKALAADVRERCRKMLARLEEEDEHGEPFLTGHAARDLSQKYDDLKENQLVAAELQVQRLEAELAAAARRAAGNKSPAKAELLLRMVESLRDPLDVTYNELWKTCVRIDSITRTRVKKHNHSGTRTHWRGTIEISGDGQTFAAPFSGELLDGAVTELPRKTDFALEQMLQGVPFREIKQTNAEGVRSALAEKLGFDSRFFTLTTCPDARLVKIAARLARDGQARDPYRIAEETAEPLELLNQVLERLTSGRPDWGRFTAQLNKESLAA